MRLGSAVGRCSVRGGGCGKVLCVVVCSHVRLCAGRCVVVR